MAYKRTVIVGGGFGGLNVALKLKDAAMDVLVIDRTNHHLFQPLLYQVATAALSPGEIGTPIREILRKHDNTSVIMGEVVSFNKKEKTLLMANGEKLSFDSLVIAIGARHSYFGNDQWESYAPGLKTLQDALHIRDQILISFEKAERLDSYAQAEKYLNFVIIGGGPTGVEMAGAIAEIAHHTLFRNFRRIKPEKSKIYLVEAMNHILPTYPEKLSREAEKDLTELGVHVMTNKRVTNICSEGVQIEEQFIACHNIIWAAGNQVSSLLQSLDTPLDRQGRAIVEPDLCLPNHPDIFIIGDAAHAKGANDKPLPGMAPVAIQQGKYVANIIKNEIPKDKRKPFVYFDKGSMATIGKFKAIAIAGKLQFSGFLAWSAWCFIHIIYLIGYRNRISVMLEWFFFFLTGQRGVRLIYRTLDKELPQKEIMD